MLKQLRVRNFAVVDEVALEFSDGLTVISGETGAGKSLLMNALAGLAGARLENSLVRDAAPSAEIEGLFELSAAELERWRALGLKVEKPLVEVRRTLEAAGKSTASIAGRSVSLALLSKAMRTQIDVAGQHDAFALLDEPRQLQLLDAYGQSQTDAAVCRRYAASYAQWRAAALALTALGDCEAHARRMAALEQDIGEGLSLGAKPGEDAALEKERSRLAGFERLKSQVAAALQLLAEGEAASTAGIARALPKLLDAAQLDDALAPMVSHVLTAQVELDSAEKKLKRYLDQVEGNPNRLEEIDQRLHALRRWMRRNGGSLESALETVERQREESERLRLDWERRANLVKESARAREEAESAAEALSLWRQAAADRLSQEMSKKLDELRLSGAHLEWDFSPSQELAASGRDRVALLFSANRGARLRPLSKVASGGESSRLMLAFRVALAAAYPSQTLVLDEADAGVGGGISDLVGRLLRKLGQGRQVLCITHAPQVAAHGDQHLRISKVARGSGMNTVVQRLDNGADRAMELARMLAGGSLVPEVLAAAEALLRGAQPGRPTSGKVRRRTVSQVCAA